HSVRSDGEVDRTHGALIYPAGACGGDGLLAGAAEVPGDLPAPAFFGIAHLVAAEAADRLDRSVAGFTRRQRKVQESRLTWILRRRAVRQYAHHGHAELFDDRRVRLRRTANFDAVAQGISPIQRLGSGRLHEGLEGLLIEIR